MRIDLNTADITNLPAEMMINHQDVGVHEVIFSDYNKPIAIPARSLILNLIFWDPNYRLGLKPVLNDFINFKSITTDVIKDRQTALYERALNELPTVPHMRIVLEYLYNVDKLSNFAQRFLGNYMPSIDALALAKILHHPSIQAIIKKPIADMMGTKVAEQSLKNAANMLVQSLSEIGSKDNCLYPYMRAKTLKSNQIPQFLHAYGTRSDIDDTMMKHIVTHSSFEGLKNVYDYAVEYLSAKKSIYFSHDVIKDSQYFARKLRLSCSSLIRVYPGSCGSEGWIPFTIPTEYAKNYIDRTVIDGDKRIYLNKENIKNYLGHPIKLVSQFACRCTDGMCEHCAGYGRDRLIRYLPPDIHIGILAEFMLASMISQQVLSTKHLVIGVTMVYVLADIARKYLVQKDNAIYWKSEHEKAFSQFYIRIPRKAMQQVADLNCRSLPNVESFSSISYLDLVKDGEVQDRIDLNSGAFIPYFSKDMLKFMKMHIKQIVVEPGYIDIPLAGYDPNIPMFHFTSLNDDMRAFVGQVTSFLTDEISKYTSIPTAIEEFSRLIYKKASINSFFMETVLRAQLINAEGDYTMPIITDPFDVHFGKMADVISERTVTGKFAFERMIDYIKKPTTPLMAKPAGLFGPHFGFVN